MNTLQTAIQNLTPPTQAELARRVKAAPQEVNRWVKRGWAAPKYASAIARAANVPVIGLLDDITNAPKS